MPNIRIDMIEGRTVEQKRVLVEKVTDAVCESVNTTPDRVKILIFDVLKSNQAVGGKLFIYNSTFSQ